MQSLLDREGTWFRRAATVSLTGVVVDEKLTQLHALRQAKLTSCRVSADILQHLRDRGVELILVNCEASSGSRLALASVDGSSQTRSSEAVSSRER